MLATKNLTVCPHIYIYIYIYIYINSVCAHWISMKFDIGSPNKIRRHFTVLGKIRQNDLHCTCTFPRIAEYLLQWKPVSNVSIRNKSYTFCVRYNCPVSLTVLIVTKQERPNTPAVVLRMHVLIHLKTEIDLNWIQGFSSYHSVNPPSKCSASRL